MKIVFMGTPDFAVPSLKGLIEDRDIEILAVVTQPDRSKGRGRKVVFSPVKELAVRHEIPVLQPHRIRGDSEFTETVRALEPDAIVVVAFGQIIPREILEIPRLGCINVHGSLLPKYRGAAPIQWAVLSGDKVSGVTTMLMDEGLDTGDMLLKKERLLEEKETSLSLSEKLAADGARLLIETLKALDRGEIQPQKQDDSQTGAYAKMLSKEMGELDFNRSAVEIDRLIRGLYPWPGTYTYLDDKVLRIWDADIMPEASSEYGAGSVAEIAKDSFSIQTGEGLLLVREVQLEGKKRMDAGSFLRGCRITKGQRLGKEVL